MIIRFLLAPTFLILSYRYQVCSIDIFGRDSSRYGAAENLWHLCGRSHEESLPYARDAYKKWRIRYTDQFSHWHRPDVASPMTMLGLCRNGCFWIFKRKFCRKPSSMSSRPQSLHIKNINVLPAYSPHSALQSEWLLKWLSTLSFVINQLEMAHTETIPWIQWLQSVPFDLFTRYCGDIWESRRLSVSNKVRSISKK